MRTRFVLTALVGFGVAGLALADTKADKSSADLQGRWKITKGEEGGKALPPAHLKDDVLHIKGNKMTLVNKAAKETWVMTFKADPSSKPAKLSMKVVKGMGAGKSAQGIYELHGDTLKICYTPEGKDAPTDFTTTEGGHQMLFVLQREKKKD